MTADNLSSAIDSIPPSESESFLVDITTFTHESLLILFKLLSSPSRQNRRITYIYTSARDYSTSEAGDQKWLSKGIVEIRSVLGFVGEVMPARKNHLIVLVGYEHERASRLIESFEPNRLSLGHGRAGSVTSPSHYEANRYFHRLVLNAAARYANVTSFEFSCNDPYEARDAILAQATSTPDSNHIVAPMNTKISTLGCALATVRDPTIQLCYAQPSQYNYESYSASGESCYLFDHDELLPNVRVSPAVGGSSVVADAVVDRFQS
jgi:hypothetical protein